MSDLESQGPSRGQSLYVVAWRWHFYAGLYVIPFLLMLAVTGFFMLLLTTYLPEDGRRWAVVPAAKALTPEAQVAAALAAVPGATGIAEYITPYDATTPAMVSVQVPEGEVVLAVSPYDGAVLRQSRPNDSWNLWFETIHGTLMLGTLGDRLIEVAAGLGLILVVTGLYLWWPRGGAPWSRLLVPNLSARGRALWKSLHQVTGVWMSLVLVGFLVTGLAWTGVWGEKFTQAWSTFPAEKWDAVPLSDQTHIQLNGAGVKTVPWGMEQTPLPLSGSMAGVQVLAEGAPVGLDAVVAIGRISGLAGRFRVAFPGDATGVWTLDQNTMSYDAASPTGDRTLHVDQYTGKVLADVRFADYGLAAKGMAMGTALHEGQLGLWNVLANAALCLAVVLTCLSGVVMWWKRRPSGAGRLVAPPLPVDMPLWKGAVLVALVLSLAVPLVGLTLLAVWLLDRVVLAHLPGLKRTLS